MKRLFAIIAICAPSLCLAQQDAQSVVAKAREAIGIDSRVGYYMAIGNSDYQGANVDFKLAFDSESRYITTLGGLMPITLGFDGTTTWELEQGIPGRATMFGERDNSLLSNWFVTGDWTRTDSRLFFSLIVDTTNSERTIRLAFSLEGSPVKGMIELDAQTYLPQKISWSAGTLNVTQELSDFREFDGVMIPVRIIQNASSGLQLTIQVQRVVQLPERDVRIFAMPGHSGDESIFDAEASAELDVIKAPTGHLLVRALIDEEDFGWFIFDTGAGANVIASSVAKAAGFKQIGSVQALGVGGPADANYYRTMNLKIGKLTLKEPNFVGFDLSPFEQHVGVKLAGLIGYPVISRAIIELDIDAGKIALHEPSTYKEPAGLEWQPMVLYNRQPCILAMFEEFEGMFVLDTGASGSGVTIHEEAVRKHQLLVSRKTSNGSLDGVGGSVSTRNGILVSLSFAEHEFVDVDTEFATIATGVFADPYISGNIGSKILAPFTLVIDYPNNQIAFVKKTE